MLDLLAAAALSLGGQTAETAPAAATAEHCGALSKKLGSEFGAVESVAVAASGEDPAYCKVSGTILPTITFEMRLPIGNWNGKYYQAGCGGFCGNVITGGPAYSNSIVTATRRGYAAIATDNGHRGSSPGDASWAQGNPQGLDLFKGKWIPLTHAAGTSIVRAFYGQQPRLHYFVGCSNGGRAALVAAQRYPTLFQGIISGCPVINMTKSGGILGSWMNKVNLKDGKPVLTSDFVRKLPFLERQAIKQCDARDGKRDGLISQPYGCRINFSAIKSCPVGQSATETADDCLTADEKSVVAKWYQGPVDSKGRKLLAGFPVGSESYWNFWYLRGMNQARGNDLAGGFLRYLAFDGTRPTMTGADFDFDKDPAKLEPLARELDPTNPDLSAFDNAGGKLIMWHGMADPLSVPYQSVTYYQSVLRRMGGAARVQKFFRYFLAPGLGHYWEAASSTAPEEFDPLTPLETWVEKGRAPDQIIATPSSRQGALPVSKVVYRPYPQMPKSLVADNGGAVSQ